MVIPWSLSAHDIAHHAADGARLGRPWSVLAGEVRLQAMRQYRQNTRQGSMSDSRQLRSARAGIVGDVTQTITGVSALDDERRYQAAVSKDPRFDGVFFIAVTSTGIYCRPSCPAITPKRENMRFYRSAAAAQEAGFRACKRCRPDASPGSPEWNIRADMVGRAMRLIADGAVDRDGVEGLARRLGYEQRQVRRLVTAELGAGPLSEIAFAAGFASIRQFNATIREAFAVTPTQLRGAGPKAAPTRRLLPLPSGDPAAPGLIRIRLAYRAPIDAERMLGFLAARAIPGVESVQDGRYRRTIQLPNGAGILSLGPLVPSPAQRGPGYIACELQLEDLRDLTAAAQRCRRLLDLDADPEAVTGYLSADPVLGPLALAHPGRRSPGHTDGSELALRAVLGQQVSVAAARRLGARLVASYGKPLSRPDGPLTHCFPTAETLAAADPATLPMPQGRALALTGLAAALASGELSLDPGAERDRAEAVLLALPGIGPWTASYIRMRALSDPDAFLPTDVGVLDALSRLGAVSQPAGSQPAGSQPAGSQPAGSQPAGPAVGTGPAARARNAKAAAALAESWRPWRSYAVHHLWAYLEEKDHHDQPVRSAGR